MLRSEDVRDDDVVEKAGDGFLRVSKARGSTDGRDSTVHESIGVVWRVIGHRGGCRVRVVVFRGFPEKRDQRRKEIQRTKKDQTSFGLIYWYLLV